MCPYFCDISVNLSMKIPRSLPTAHLVKACQDNMSSPGLAWCHSSGARSVSVHCSPVGESKSLKKLCWNDNFCHHILCIYCEVAITLRQHWFQLWFIVISQQAITLSSVDPDLCCHLASLDYSHAEFILWSFFYHSLEMVQVVKIVPHGGQWPICLAQLVSWVLMSWWCKEPGASVTNAKSLLAKSF